MKGTVVTVFLNKGFCFVRGQEDREMRFAHCRSFKDSTQFDTIAEGNAVEYEPVDDKPIAGKHNGKRAVNIRVVRA